MTARNGQFVSISAEKANAVFIQALKTAGENVSVNKMEKLRAFGLLLAGRAESDGAESTGFELYRPRAQV